MFASKYKKYKNWRQKERPDAAKISALTQSYFKKGPQSIKSLACKHGPNKDGNPNFRKLVNGAKRQEVLRLARKDVSNGGVWDGRGDEGANFEVPPNSKVDVKNSPAACGSGPHSDGPLQVAKVFKKHEGLMFASRYKKYKEWRHKERPDAAKISVLTQSH